MLKVAVKGLATRRLRAVLTALAIVLGVALVAGTYVLTDSLHADLGSVYQTIYKNTAASITGRNAIDTGANAANGGDVPTFPETLLARVKRLPGVAEASGGVSGTAQLVLGGKTVSFGSSPTLGSSVDPSAPQLSSLKLVSGHWPGATGLVVDTNTASKKHLKVGQLIGVQADGPVLHLRISGIVKFGSASSLGGTTLTGFTLPTAQRLFSKPGQLDTINVAAKSGTSPQQLVDEIKPILPRDAQVRTGAQQAQTDTNSLDSSLGFLNTLLLAFAGIALFVGAFVIANSLSITIAQRTREFATLRTLGASRRQVLRSVLAESLIIGVLASIVGLVVGIFLAKGLFALFNAVGLSLPNGGTVLKSRTIIVSLVVGIVVTMLASLRPALRATRVEPIAAVREGATLPPGRFARFRTAGSAIVIALGFLLIVLGLFVAHGTGPVLALMGAGAILVFIGLSLLSARFVPGMALWIGWPATVIAGAIGRLARDNAMRNPQRTASTAVGADDRAGAGDARVDHGRRDHLQLQGRGERAVRRRLRDRRRQQLLADPDLGRRGGRAGAGRDRGRQRPRRPGQGVRLDRQPDRRQPRASRRRSRATGSTARSGRSPRSDPRGRSCPRASRRSTTCRSARR